MPSRHGSFSEHAGETPCQRLTPNDPRLGSQRVGTARGVVVGEGEGGREEGRKEREVKEREREMGNQNKITRSVYRVSWRVGDIFLFYKVIHSPSHYPLSRLHFVPELKREKKLYPYIDCIRLSLIS